MYQQQRKRLSSSLVLCLLLLTISTDLLSLIVTVRLSKILLTHMHALLLFFPILLTLKICPLPFASLTQPLLLSRSVLHFFLLALSCCGFFIHSSYLLVLAHRALRCVALLGFLFISFACFL